ncbi:MAG TPA: phosphatase PAP2 family protein [Feifaniaceae bacterium]|nr:phosphatase PAP2 family protein [Feifaniaceae bacterium]
MEFLHALAKIRTPFWDAVMAYVTYLGDETVFMAVGLIVIWCIDKKWGFRLFYMGLLGGVLNQLLKAIFLLPRPWVQDPSFSIVESARAGATGYSFPSGHTQSAVMLFGGAAMWLKKRLVTVTAVVLVLLTAFSRMYLGVHTPLDVGVSLLTGVLLLILMHFAFRYADSGRGAVRVLGGAGMLFCAAVVLYLLLAPASAANVAEFDAHGRESVWSLTGGMLGLLAIWWLDDRYLKFPVKAVWWVQIIKCLGGLGILMFVRVVLKAPLLALFGGDAAANGLRYFLMTLAGGAAWPMTFRFFSKLGA